MSEGTSLRVMLVDDDIERSATIERALLAEGHQVAVRLDTRADLRGAVRVHHPQIIFIDVEAPGRDILDSLGDLYQERPRPVVLCTAHSDSTTTRRALHVGVSAYVVAGLSLPATLSALLDLAIARFEMQQTLRTELDRAKTRLADQRDIEKAKGLLMKHRAIDEAEAYKLLRRMAMDRKQRIGDVARTLMTAADLWEGISS